MAKKDFKKDLWVWYGILERGLIVLGLTFFGFAMSNNLTLSFKTPFVVAGLYCFTELAKNYNIDMTKTQGKKTNFLLFP